MSSLDKCTDIKTFNNLLDLDKVQVKIGKRGGRYFLVDGKSLSMNQIVHKLEELAHTPAQAKELNLARRNVALLNVVGNVLLKNSSPRIQRLTAMRHFFGKVGAKLRYGLTFNKDKILKTYSRVAAREMMTQPESTELRLERRAKILGDLGHLSAPQKELLLKVDTRLWGKYQDYVEGEGSFVKVVDAFRDQLGQTTRENLAELLRGIQKEAVQKQLQEPSEENLDKVD